MTERVCRELERSYDDLENEEIARHGALSRAIANAAREWRRGRHASPSYVAHATPVDDLRLRSILARLTGSVPRTPIEFMTNEEMKDFARKIERALVRERGKARAGHYSYDANRHIALHQAARQLEILMEGDPG